MIECIRNQIGLYRFPSQPFGIRTHVVADIEITGDHGFIVGSIKWPCPAITDNPAVYTAHHLADDLGAHKNPFIFPIICIDLIVVYFFNKIILLKNIFHPVY